MASVKIMSLCLVTLSLAVLVVAHSSVFESTGHNLEPVSYNRQCQLKYVSDYELLRELELRRQSYTSSLTSQGGSAVADELSLEELLISSGRLGSGSSSSSSSSSGAFQGHNGHGLHGHGPVVSPSSGGVTSGVHGGPGPVRLSGGQGGFRGRGPQGASGAGAVGSAGALGAIGSIQAEREHGSFHKSGVGASHTTGAFKDVSGHNRENIRTNTKGFGHETIKDVNIDQDFRDHEGFLNQDKIGAGQSSGEFDRQSGKAIGAIGAIGGKGAAGIGSAGSL